MDALRRGFVDTEPAQELDQIRDGANRWRAVFAVTLLLMAALIWGAWLESTDYERRQTLQATARRQTNLAISAEHYLERVMRNFDAVASLLIDVYRSSPREGFAEALADRARNNDIFAELSACFDDGTWLSSQREPDPHPHADWCRKWIAGQADAGNTSVIALPVPDAESVMVPITRPLQPGPGKPGGILVALVDVRRLLGLLQDYSIQESTSLLVSGHDGIPRARWHSRSAMSEQRAPEKAFVTQLHNQPPGTLAVDDDGHRHFATIRRMAIYPLTVTVATLEDDVLREFRRRSRAYVLASMLACGLLAAASLVLLRLHARASRMAESLSRARGRLQALNAELEGEVRERTRELESAYRDLEAFTYTVAHDVRAPIAAIRGFAGVVTPAIERTGDARLIHYMKRILANASQMNDLTESLLALGKLTRAPVNLAEIDLSQMANEVFAGLREREPYPRNVREEVQVGIRVMADRVLLRQVVENLLGNAWKFTARRELAEIRVTAEHDGTPGRLVVSIRDNGAGFDIAKAGNLLKPFHRMHTASDFPGTGIGLATADRIMRLHGGRLWIDSREGEGTSVHFTVQAAPVRG